MRQELKVSGIDIVCNNCKSDEVTFRIKNDKIEEIICSNCNFNAQLLEV